MSEEENTEETQEVVEITYIPLGDEPFGEKEMFAQGAAALDLAAIFALEQKDVAGLVNVAKGWTKLGLALAGIEELTEEKKVLLKFGFGKDIEEENSGETPNKGDSENELQNRRARLCKYRTRIN